MRLEPIPTPKPGFAEVVASFGMAHIATAVAAFLFAISAPLAIILSVGLKGGLTEAEIASWIFAAFAINGVVSFVLSAAYRMPLVHLWAIPGAVIVGAALTHLTFSEVIGAYIVTGVVLMVLGVSGLIRRIMSVIPMPIVMGMVGGIFLQFGLNWIDALWSDVWVALPMTAAYLLFSISPKISERFPPLIAAILAGFIELAWSGRMGAVAQAVAPYSGSGSIWTQPVFHMPQFSLAATLELVVPLVVTVVVAQNAQGLAVLRSAGHEPPTNTITAACGLASLLTAPFGCVSTCLTGPSNAILSSDGERPVQYMAALVFSVLAIAFGLLAPVFTKILLALPHGFLDTLAGLALLRMLQSSFRISFGGKFSLGGLIAFMTAIANHPIYNAAFNGAQLLWIFLTDP